MLRDICAQLPASGAVPALLAALAGTGNSSISNFELLSSGAVKALRCYLQGEDLPDAPASQRLLLERLGDFAGMLCAAVGSMLRSDAAAWATQLAWAACLLALPCKALNCACCALLLRCCMRCWWFERPDAWCCLAVSEAAYVCVRGGLMRT